jgi:hypothetical protein
MANVTIFKLLESKDKKTKTLKVNIDPKYGVKAVTVTLNDGTKVELGDETPIYSTTPTKRVEQLLERGVITEEQAQQRLEKIPGFIKAEFDLPVKSKAK